MKEEGKEEVEDKEEEARKDEEDEEEEEEQSRGSDSPKGRKKEEVWSWTHLEESKGFDQAAHFVLQGEHHCRLPQILRSVLVLVLVDGTEGRTPRLEEEGGAAKNGNGCKNKVKK